MLMKSLELDHSSAVLRLVKDLMLRERERERERLIEYYFIENPIFDEFQRSL
jgi:hypothetical protein